MLIYDLLSEHKSKQKYITSKDDAMNTFIQQKRSIDAIKHTKWFVEIMDYWKRIVLACNDRLRTVKVDDIKRAQGELDIAMSFLDFLDNILLAELDREDLDILQSN